MNFETFQNVLTLMMCDDIPGNQVVGGEAREKLERWANEQARAFGFIDWIAAYHFDGFPHTTTTQQA